MPLLDLSSETTERFIHQKFFFPILLVLSLFHDDALIILMLFFFILFLFYHEHLVVYKFFAFCFQVLPEIVANTT